MACRFSTVAGFFLFLLESVPKWWNYSKFGMWCVTEQWLCGKIVIRCHWGCFHFFHSIMQNSYHLCEHVRVYFSSLCYTFMQWFFVYLSAITSVVWICVLPLTEMHCCRTVNWIGIFLIMLANSDTDTSTEYGIFFSFYCSPSFSIALNGV